MKNLIFIQTLAIALIVGGVFSTVVSGLRADETPVKTTKGETLSKEKMVDLLKGIDLRIRSSGDYKALFYLEQREKEKPDVVREGLAYRRDADEKLMIIFSN